MANSNDKRIAKNTFFLYIRMFLALVVGLYTARVVLQTLGVIDYGINNVVGGVISMCAFLSSTLAAASQRFFSFELGKENKSQLQKVFSITVTIYIIFIIVIIILAETAGLWLVNSKLEIPESRIYAANVVYQMSLLGLVFSLLRVPYDGLIIAHERMSFYAWISIVEISLKLVIVYFLVIFSYDKLELYSELMFLVIFFVSIGYYAYCNHYFEECKLKFQKDLLLYKSLLSFAGWNLFASVANMSLDQGLNILLNIFFGPAINAARAIAFQVKMQIVSFVGNFQMASTPQIIKYYAASEIEQMKKLLFRSSRMSFYLLLLVSMPVLLEIEQFLTWWLGSYPHYTIIFTRLVIINVLVDCMSGTLVPAVQATGKIKIYQITVGSILIAVLPISYIFLLLGFQPQITMIVSIVMGLFCLFGRLIITRKLLGIKIKEYLFYVTYDNIKILLCSLIIPLIIYMKMQKGLMTFIIVCMASVISVCLVVYFIGLSKNERIGLCKIILKK